MDMDARRQFEQKEAKSAKRSVRARTALSFALAFWTRAEREVSRQRARRADAAASDNAPVLWRYARRADGAAWGLATRNITTTGIALTAGRLFLNTFDGHTIALDTATGNVLWDVAMAEIDQGQSLLAAPLVAGDRVFIGSNGGDFGVRGWVAALDAPSGRVLWRRYNAGPDVDVGVGKDFRSQYLPAQADLGVSSWPPDTWQQGGGDLAGTPASNTVPGETP